MAQHVTMAREPQMPFFPYFETRRMLPLRMVTTLR